MGLQLGLDTGGTYTDAVLVDDDQQVIAHAKCLTSHANLIDGLRGAVQAVLTNVAASDVNLVSVSTTLATNALVEGRGRSVALILIGFDEKQMHRAGLRTALGSDPVFMIAGGHTASGDEREVLDLPALRAAIEGVVDEVDAYAVSAVFAVRNPAHEISAQSMIRELTGKPVSCGHHLSSGLDAPRRALTALLNARLIPMIGALLSASRELLIEKNVAAPLMVVKGDGSLIAAEVAAQCPVETILSGPAASVVGAQFLCKQPRLIVSDMGGTTTDIAMIENGQPSLDPNGATIGSFRTMVNAIDVRTFGLGGDSRIYFDRSQRDFVIGQQRVMSLSLLVAQYPELLDVLQAQLELPRSTTHSAEFVLVHAAPATRLSAQQQELYDRIAEKPVALQTLFSEQTLERALVKLEQRGIVLRAGFTPSDASHITGHQSAWSREAAVIGAKLLQRYAQNNLGPSYDSVESFASAMREAVSRQTALAIVETAYAAGQGSRRQQSGRGGDGRRNSRELGSAELALLRECFARDSEHDGSGAGSGSGASLDSGTGSGRGPELTLRANIASPIVGLGAPAVSYYERSAELLETQAILPEYAGVANALGAVVGSVRQRQVIMITPAGGGRQVKVMYPEGPTTYATLEEGAAAATDRAESMARLKAEAAGAVAIDVTTTREDNAVTEGNETVFFESRITALASGRPATSVKD